MDEKWFAGISADVIQGFDRDTLDDAQQQVFGNLLREAVTDANAVVAAESDRALLITQAQGRLVTLVRSEPLLADIDLPLTPVFDVPALDLPDATSAEMAEADWEDEAASGSARLEPFWGDDEDEP